MGNRKCKPQQKMLGRMIQAFCLIFFWSSETAFGAARQAAAVHERANAVLENSPYDPLWRKQCGSVQDVHTVKYADTAKQLMEAVYPRVSWEPMWALVALCNSKSVAAFNPGLDGMEPLPEGTILSLPVFQLPNAAAPAQIAAQQQQQPATRATDTSSTMPSQDQAGVDTTAGSEMTAVAASSSRNSSTQSSSSAWASSPVCGCGNTIQITQPSSWLQIAQQQYPDMLSLQAAALLLSVCNADVVLTVNMLVKPGQNILGICDAAAATAVAATAKLGYGNSSLAVSQAQVTDGTSIEGRSASSSSASAVTTVAAAGTTRGAQAALPLHQTSEVPMCSVVTLAGQGSYLRQVDVQPAADCPWYADGCSGPTQGLQYQDVLTPCCNAHDYCYLCSYTLGWAGSNGRQHCDHLMLSNMLRACENSFPVGGWWDWKAKWHKFWCESTANVMFAAVWAYQEIKGGTVHADLQCLGDYSSLLGAADFCFYR